MKFGASVSCVLSSKVLVNLGRYDSHKDRQGPPLSLLLFVPVGAEQRSTFIWSHLTSRACADKLPKNGTGF